jgi:hypothetical protein
MAIPKSEGATILAAPPLHRMAGEQDARKAKNPDHLTMIGAFLYKCLTMIAPGSGGRHSGTLLVSS